MLALRREAEALVSAATKGKQKQQQPKATASNNNNSGAPFLPPPVSLPALSALSAPLSHPSQ